jgi:hypothetical protein
MFWEYRSCSITDNLERHVGSILWFAHVTRYNAFCTRSALQLSSYVCKLQSAVFFWVSVLGGIIWLGLPVVWHAQSGIQG